MICPKCKAEYRDGFTVCADCLVPLIWQLPSPPERPETTGNADQAGSSPFDPRLHEDPFCAFWQGEDTRIHAELCAVLQEAGIPCKTVRREDHLFRLSATSALKIGVPFSLYEKAEAAVKEAFGSNEDGADAVRLLPSARNAVETRDDSEHASSAASQFDPQNFLPEDATAEVWSGDDSHFADFLFSCLHTNEIQCRRDKEGKHHLLLVLPEYAERAREIVREVVEAAPPAE